MTSILSALIILAAALPAACSQEVLIKLKPPSAKLQTAAARANLLARSSAVVSAVKGAKLGRPIPAIGYQRVTLPDGVDLNEALKKLRANPEVAYAGANNRIRIASDPPQVMPDDPVFYSGDDFWGLPQWGLYNDGSNGDQGGTYRADIHAPEAWAVTTGSPNVPIAIVDTGIDFGHPDLINKQWINTGEVYNNGIDDDHNGFIDDWSGWNFVDETNDTWDDNDISHGTFVAGIAAAESNNNLGIAGVAWGCPLVALKVIKADGSGLEADAAEAAVYAADMGIKVINMSISGDPVPALEDAVEYAWTKGSMCIVATGNDGTSGPSYPAQYPHALAVGASNEDDKRCTAADWFSGGSNYGDYIDVVAPGSWIVSCSNLMDYGGYDTQPGTSAAAPFVSGVAALIWSQFPTWTNAQVFQQIIRTADDCQTIGFDIETGWGRVNAYRALTETSVPMNSIAAVKSTQLNKTIELTGQILSTASGEILGRLYVQSRNRTAGLRIEVGNNPPAGLARGDEVQIFGTLSKVSGELALTSATVKKVAAGPAPRPLGMLQRGLGGQAMGNQPGVVDRYSLPRKMAAGLNNIGLLVTVAGKVTAVGYDWFYIDDGMKLDDGTGRIGVYVYNGSLERPGIGQYAVITGISSCEQPAGSSVCRRVLMPRAQDDIRVP